MRTFPFLILLGGCGALPGIGEDWQPVTYVDEGDACFQNQGADVVVDVTAPACLSSSCSRDLGGSCEAVVDGDTITLSSEIFWEQNEGALECTDDCGAPTVSCTLPALADGTYTVVHGDQEITLVIPVDQTCADL